jgi:alkylated DNA repair dioxygenase AlkB
VKQLAPVELLKLPARGKIRNDEEQAIPQEWVERFETCGRLLYKVRLYAVVTHTSYTEMSLAFSDYRGLELLPVPDAEVLYAPRVDFGEPDQAILAHLIETIPWRSESIVLWGKSYVQPRLIAWYGDPAATYTYSGLTLTPLPWTPTLMRIKQRVEQISDATFNSVLLNYYRDGQDSMGFHSDDEPELGPAPVIASVSFGEERTFVLKHKRKKSLKPIRLPLASGSLLLMRGETQRNWRHAVEKEDRPCGPRINLTFRRIVPI